MERMPGGNPAKCQSENRDYGGDRDCENSERRGLMTPGAGGMIRFQRRQKGMLTEVLTQYGPVNRLWCDCPPSSPTSSCPARPASAPSSVC